MSIVAWLGTGLLGSAFVEALLARGHTVNVWNRTRAKAERLAALGARVFDEPDEAVRNATRIHVCLSDDAAVDGVLDRILPALGSDAWVVDHTTTSPLGTARRHARARERGFLFAHAPVFMGPPMARAAKGLMLLSGPRENEAALRPLLEPMTGELIYLGAREDLAASYKLFGNAMIIAVAGGLADVFAMVRALGIDPEAAITLFDKFNIAAGVPVRGQRMAKGEFVPPGFELAMARKDVRLMIEAAGDRPLAILPALAARMDALIREGHGAADLGVLAVDDDAPRPEPTPRERVLERLRATHRRIEERMGELATAIRGGDASTIDDVLAFFERSITRHEEDEERSLFPRLTEAPQAAAPIAVLSAEHQAQRELWSRLRDATQGARGALQSIAGELASSYVRHVQLEERELFPILIEAFSDDTWRAIDTEMSSRRGGGGGGGRGGGGGGGRRRG